MKDPAKVVMDRIRAEAEFRRQALLWWRTMTPEKQAEVHANSDRHYWSLQMFCMSTSAITTAWKKQHDC